MSAPEDIRLSAAADVRENVRQRYAKAACASAAANHEQARAVEASEPDLAVQTSCCGGALVAATGVQGLEVFGAELYRPDSALDAPDAAWP